MGGQDEVGGPGKAPPQPAPNLGYQPGRRLLIHLVGTPAYARPSAGSGEQNPERMKDGSSKSSTTKPVGVCILVGPSLPHRRTSSAQLAIVRPLCHKATFSPPPRRTPTLPAQHNPHPARVPGTAAIPKRACRCSRPSPNRLFAARRLVLPVLSVARIQALPGTAAIPKSACRCSRPSPNRLFA